MTTGLVTCPVCARTVELTQPGVLELHRCACIWCHTLHEQAPAECARKQRVAEAIRRFGERQR